MAWILSYAELLGHMRRGLRNGRWRELENDLDRVKYRACLEFARVNNGIRNPTMVGWLLGIIERLKAAVRIRVLRVGRIKAGEMLSQYARRGTFKWFPRLKAWLRDPAYILWLGSTQISLGEFYRVGFRMSAKRN